MRKILPVAGLLLLGGCAAKEPQNASLSPPAEGKARIIVYTADDYRPIIAHTVRINQIETGRLNGPNQFALRDVDPGAQVVDATVAGLFADKTPHAQTIEDLKGGDTWYVRLSEVGVGCRELPVAEVIIMTGLVGLLVEQAMKDPGKPMRRCDSFSPLLEVATDKTGRADLNKIVYGVADPSTGPVVTRPATGMEALNSPAALETAAKDWPLFHAALRRHYENNSGEYISLANVGGRAIVGGDFTLRKIERVDPGRVLMVVDYSGNTTSGLSSFRVPLRASLMSDGADRGYRVEGVLPVAGVIDGTGQTRSLADVEAEWPRIKVTLDRHFKRNSGIYGSLLGTTNSTVDEGNFKLVDVVPSDPDAVGIQVRFFGSAKFSTGTDSRGFNRMLYYRLKDDGTAYVVEAFAMSSDAIMRSK